MPSRNPRTEPGLTGQPGAVVAQIAAVGEKVMAGAPGRQTQWRLWGQGPALVLLHGNYGGWTHWIGNIPALSRSFRVLVPDMPGFGASDLPPEPQSAESLAAGLHEDLTSLDAGPFHVVGFSFGSTVAAALSLALGRHAKTLTLLSTGHFGMTRADPGLLVNWRKLSDPADIEEAHRANLATMMIGRAERIDALALHIQAINTRAKRLHTEPIARAAPLRGLILEQACPIRAMFGDLDRTIGPNMQERIDFFERLGRRASTAVIHDAGHWLQYERPEEFLAALTAGF